MKRLLLSLLLPFTFNSCQKMNKDLKKETIRLCFRANPTTVDTRKNADVLSSYLQFMIFEGLTRLLPDGEVEFALAESVEISKDGLTYIFHLKEAEWSDGHPITAYDFEYSWKKILTPSFGSPCPYLLFCIENAEEAVAGKISPERTGIKALDDSTLRIQLKHPTPYFLSLISFCNFFPIPQHIELENPLWYLKVDKTLVCNGPFRIEKWIPNQEILVVRNPTHWDAGNVHLDAIHVSIVEDEATSLRMFENGEIDLLNSITSSLSIDEIVALKKQNKVETKPVGGTLFVTFNLNLPFLKNLSIRKALSSAINRNSIIENISQLSEFPATRLIPPSLIHNLDETVQFNDSVHPKILFDQGLKELGFDPKDPSLKKNPAYLEMIDGLTLIYESIELHGRIAQTIQQQWKAAFGFEIKLQEFDFKTQIANLQNKNYSIGLGYWIVQYTDPVSILERFKYKDSKKNYPGYENPKYIDLLGQAQITNDPKLRLKFLEDAERLIVSEMPLAPIFHFNYAILKNSKFTDIEFSPIGNLIYKKIRPKEQHDIDDARN